MPQQPSNLLKQSYIFLKPSSLKPNSIKRNKSTEIFRPSIPPGLPEIQKYDTSKLFEEFKKSLLNQDRKELNKHTTLNNHYKNLICSIKKEKDEKRKQLEGLTNKLKTINQTKNWSSSYLLKDIKNHQSTKKIIEEPIERSQQNLKQDFSICKFKPIRPMTSETKFRISDKKSRINNINSSSGKQPNENQPVTLHNSRGTRLSEIQVISRSQPSKDPQKSLSQISQCILMVQVQQNQLEGEIFSLKQSLTKLKKQLETVKKDLEIQKRNEQKYKHIMYLATSIMNQTQYIKQQNSKGFTSMAQRQDETLTQLKKFKTSLKKEKDDMETEYIADINKWVEAHEEINASKKRSFLFSPTQTPKNNEDSKSPFKKFELITKSLSYSAKSSSHAAKSIKKLIQQFDKIVQLLQTNQQNIEEIKQKECTKVRLGKINKSLLAKPKIQIMQKIEEFEQKYDMKISSVENLILNVYESLFKNNRALESDCLNLTNRREQLYKDLKEIEEKHQTEIDIYEKQFKLITCEQIDMKKRNQILKRNSIVFLRIIEAFYTMLFKFRYMFALALTLDIDKKSFRDCVIQIDSCFSSGLFFNFTAQKHLITSSQRHDIINQKEFTNVLVDKRVDVGFAHQMTEMLFNDHRINLILHKSWIDNKLKPFILEEITEGEILDVIESVRADCQHAYEMRLPILARLFLTCLKSIQMTKYESKLAASSTQKQSIFLPSCKVKNIHFTQILDSNDSCDRHEEMSYYEPSKKKITFRTETEAKEEQVFEKDPRKIIYHLESIKNKHHKKFKALNFSCEGKTYKYNDQIIIPDFPMMLKEEGF